MFEWYAGYRAEPVAAFGSDGVDLESLLGGRIVRRSNMIWQEHCSECAMPRCYSTCDYYRPRPDYKCQRFDGGVQLLSATQWTTAPMRLRFGKWARLLAYGPTSLISLKDAAAQERRTLRNAIVVELLPVPRGVAAPVRRRLSNRLVRLHDWGAVDIGRLYVVMETFAEAGPVTLVFSARVLDSGDERGGEVYRRRLEVPPGHGALKIPIASFMDGPLRGRKFSLEIAPADDEHRPEVAFGLLDVVELEMGAQPAAVPPPTSTGPLKCVIWDLDNTLWEGILIEDGLGQLRLREGIIDVVRTLDSRGVLQSAVSKNNPVDAAEALEYFGLSEYFLLPQISWGPKSQAVYTIAKRLNIGLDSIAFIDDQPFERAEVSTVHPPVHVMDVDAIARLLQHPRLQYETTDESKRRRSMYQAELAREVAQYAADVDYDSFLKSCELRVTIDRLQDVDVQRVHELAQRTNQMNLSTTRYTRDQIEGFAAGTSSLEAFTIRAEDRFGTYGLVGFCVVDLAQSLILDMMFSCRVQAKLVDDSFVEWLATQWRSADSALLRAKFRPSERNLPARQLLERTGFELAETLEEHQLWEKRRTTRPFDELAGIVSVSALCVTV